MISFQSFSLERGGRPLFQRQTLVVPGGVTALIGPNGAGKTSLLKAILGELPFSGRIALNGSVGLLAQEEARDGKKVEEVLSEIWGMAPPAASFIERLTSSLDPGTSCVHLSGGEWLRLRLARCLAEAPDLILMDEPTNHLDREGRDLLTEFLRTWQGSVLLVSHDRRILREASQVLEVQPNRLRVFNLGSDEYIEEARRQRESMEEDLAAASREKKKTEEDRQAALERQDRRMARGRRLAAKGGTPKILLGGMKRRAQKTQARLDVKSAKKVNEKASELEDLWLSRIPEIKMRLAPDSIVIGPGRLIFHGRELRPRRPDGTFLWERGLTFTLRGPGRWRLRGRNGGGKSLLLRLIAGKNPGLPFDGEWAPSPLRVSFLSQELEDPRDLTLLDWLREEIPAPEEELRNRLADFGFTGSQPLMRLALMSGGEKMRASLARLMMGAEPPEVLLMDEPTNNLDLANLEALETAMAGYPGALIVVSHDDDFAEALGAEDLVDLDELGRG